MLDTIACNKTSFVVASPLGDLKVVICNELLVAIRYYCLEPMNPSTESKKQNDKAEVEELGAPVGRAARKVEYQLCRYFDDPRWCFDFDIAAQGTFFQRRVWKALKRIPSGSRLTYGKLAQSLNSGARAVGGACRCNPILIVIPCHRVVAANTIGGYCGNMKGKMLHAKNWLLQHEDADYKEIC